MNTRRKQKGRITVRPKQKSEKERTRLGAALRALGGLGGSAVGSLFGQSAAGGSAGRGIGASISKWLGSGDYTLKSNSIMQRSLNSSDSIPMMHKEGQTVVIRHKEYLGEVKGSVAFTTQHAYSLNPGQKYTFPWLSGIATQFQEYSFKGVVYHYVPTSGSAINGTNPALGSVMIQTSYRASDLNPASKVEMLNEYWSSEGAPDEAFCHPIECAPEQNPFKTQYIRTGAVPAGDNVLFYDLGRTVVATSGQQADGNVLGDLWVTYEVELRKPVVYSAANDPVASALYGCLTPSVGNWFTGTSAVLTGSLPVALSANTITFPKGAVGSFTISVRILGSFTAVDLSGNPVVTSCVVPYFNAYNNATYFRTAVSGATASTNVAFYLTTVVISDPQASATITFPAGTWTGTTTETDVTISQN